MLLIMIIGLFIQLLAFLFFADPFQHELSHTPLKNVTKLVFFDQAKYMFTIRAKPKFDTVIPTTVEPDRFISKDRLTNFFNYMLNLGIISITMNANYVDRCVYEGDENYIFRIDASDFNVIYLSNKPDKIHQIQLQTLVDDWKFTEKNIRRGPDTDFKYTNEYHRQQVFEANKRADSQNRVDCDITKDWKDNSNEYISGQLLKDFVRYIMPHLLDIKLCNAYMNRCRYDVDDKHYFLSIRKKDFSLQVLGKHELKDILYMRVQTLVDIWTRVQNIRYKLDIEEDSARQAEKLKQQLLERGNDGDESDHDSDVDGQTSNGPTILTPTELDSEFGQGSYCIIS